MVPEKQGLKLVSLFLAGCLAILSLSSGSRKTRIETDEIGGTQPPLHGLSSGSRKTRIETVKDNQADYATVELWV